MTSSSGRLLNPAEGSENWEVAIAMNGRAGTQQRITEN